jgi:phosphomannomutase/phosphoglucomutase
MINIPNNIFRGYDIRGVAEKEITEETMYVFGKAYATFLAKRRIFDCVVGHDNRLSSEKFTKNFIKGLLECGITVYNIGFSLSQIVYFAQYHFLSKGAAMISASHNPKDYNGLKLAVGFSDTMVTEEIQNFREIAQTGKFIQGKTKGKEITQDIFPSYVKDILKRNILTKRFKVLVDGCSCTPGMFYPELFRQAGCNVIEKNTHLDGNFPLGTPDPTERQHLERLAKEVIEAKADIGFTYDADGDRIGVVDEKGQIIWNDVLVSIFAMDLLDYMPGEKIIFNTLCSKQVSEVTTNHHGIPVIWKTGHSFIKAKVKEERALFGGELSGHFFFMDNFYGHDDAAMASLRILSYLERHNLSLSRLVQQLPHYFSSPETKLGCPDNIKFKLVSDKIGREMKKLYPQAEYLEIDGVRMDLPDSMFIIRASQNGPYITIKFEAKTKDKYEELRKQIKTILHKFPEINFAEGVNAEELK